MRESIGFQDLDQFLNTKYDGLLKRGLYGQSYLLGSGVVITSKDHQIHEWTIGRTQAGKSKYQLLEICQDILNGFGPLVIDPKGTLFWDVVKFCAHHNIRKVCIIDPMAKRQPSFDPLSPGGENETVEKPVGRVMDAILTAWHADIDAMPTFQLYMPAILSALQASGMTLAEFPEFIHRRSRYRQAIVRRCNPNEDYARTLADLFDPNKSGNLDWNKIEKELMSSRNRLGPFVSSASLIPIIGQGSGEDSIDIKAMVKDGWVILVNLDSSYWPSSEQQPLILGTLILNEVMDSEPEKPYHVYVDEVADFATNTLKVFLRKKAYKNLTLHLAHQYIRQLEERKIGDAIFANCGNRVVFQLRDHRDVDFISKTLFPGDAGISPQELLNLDEQWAFFKIGNEPTVKGQIPYVEDLSDQVDLDAYLESIYDEHGYKTPLQAAGLRNGRLDSLFPKKYEVSGQSREQELKVAEPTIPLKQSDNVWSFQRPDKPKPKPPDL